MYTRTFRFAPSPNGYLHLGHSYSALLNHDMAREVGGRLLLRIEDIDASRCRPEYESAIYQDLAWLGLSWQPAVRRQSEHFDDYESAVAKLEAAGLIYPSFESRSEIRALAAEHDRRGHRPRDPDGVPLYPGRASKMPRAERERRRRDGEHFDARKGLPTSYHLAVAIDDALQGVTEVVRGQDLFWSTSIHRLLQALLGLPEPIYHHHKLILDAGGRKLSKSTLATSLRELRAAGATAADIRRIVGLGR